MISEHLTDESLIGLADDPASAQETDAHVSRCAICSNLLAFYSTLNRELRGEETWAAEEEARTHRGQSAIRAFEERLAAEDAEAAELLGDALLSPSHFAQLNISSDARFRTGGVVRALLAADRAESFSRSSYSELLSRTACTIADLLPDDYYPANAVYELRGRSWHYQATSCAYLSRFEEGLEAIGRAERAYRRLPDPGPGLAATNLSHALLLWRSERCAEALPFVTAAIQEYEARGDRHKYVEAKLSRAAVFHVMRDYLAARNVYLEVLDAADELDDAPLKAVAAFDLGMNYRHMGDLDEAGRYLLLALQLAEGLGYRELIARARWAIALLALAGGNFRETELQLRSVIGEFVELRLEREVADAKVDLAEALLMLGRPAEIESLCDEAEAVYRQVGLVGRLAALRFLKNAARNHLLRREDIEYVRNYLTDSRQNPNLPFAPPPKKDH